MRRRRLPVRLTCPAVSIAMSAVLAAAVGCGSSTASTPAANPITPTTPTNPVVSGRAIDGSWALVSVQPQATLPVTSPVSFSQFFGALRTNGNQVTGNGLLLIFSPPAPASPICVQPQAAALQGTFNAARHLSLVSDGASGTTVHIELDVPADPHSIATGTVTVTGLCAIATTNLQGTLFEPVNGRYTGPVQVPDSANQQLVTLNGATETAVVSETAPDTNGKTVVTGTLTLALPTCTASFAVSVERYGAVYNVPKPVTNPAVPQIALSSTPTGDVLLPLLLGIGNDCKPQDPFGSQQNRMSGLLARQ